MCLLIGVGMGLSWHSRCERDDSGGGGVESLPGWLSGSTDPGYLGTLALVLMVWGWGFTQ